MQITIDLYWLLSTGGAVFVSLCGLMVWVVRNTITATKMHVGQNSKIDQIQKTVTEIENHMTVSRSDVRNLEARVNIHEARFPNIEANFMQRIEILETLKRCEQFFNQICMVLGQAMGKDLKIDPPDLTGPILARQQQMADKFGRQM